MHRRIFVNRRSFVKWTGAATAGLALGLRQSDGSGLTSGSSFEATPLLPYDLNAVGLIRPAVVTLDGDWHFREDPNEIGEQQAWYHSGSVRGRIGAVPLPWQLAFPELFGYEGTGWYERSVIVPPDFAGKRVALASYGISDHATIWLNGQPAGQHRGQQPPFLIDVSSLISPGRTNTITIRANDPGSRLEFDCYIRRSGLWQSLWLEATAKTYIADIFMVPDIDRQSAESRISILSIEHTSKVRQLGLKLTVVAPDGRQFAEFRQIELGPGQTSYRVAIPIGLKDVQLWGPDSPQLYRAQAILSESGKAIDTASVDFGMRKIETRGDRFYLNNQPIYLVGGGLDPGSYGGAVDVNWHAPPPYHPQADAEFRHVIELTKSLGINWVRVPLRPAPPGLLHWADRLGLLVWQGGAWNGPATPTDQIPSRAELINRWSAMVLSDHNHPSAVLWELFNEEGGMNHKNFDAVEGDLYDFIKQMDETRLVLDNAGGWAITELNYIDNHPRKCDLDDWHYYPQFDVFSDVRELLEIRSHGRPVTVGEFGPIPYICNADKIKARWGGKLPWFLQQAPKGSAAHMLWADGKYEERFYTWGLDKIFGDFTSFTNASDWYYFEGLKQQTDLMRMNGDIAGYMCWFADTTFHPVGLVDYFREKKIFCDELARIWNQNAIVVDIATRRNFWTGETVRADVHVAHFGDDTPLDGDVYWRLEGTELQGTIAGISVAAGQARHAGRIEFRAPGFEQSKSVRLEVELRRSSAAVAQNYVRIQVFPLSSGSPAGMRILLHGPIPWRFEALGYEVMRLGNQTIPSGVEKGNPYSGAIDASVPLVTTKLDAIAEKLLAEGATVLWLVCGDLLFTAAHLPGQSLDASVVPFLRRHGFDLGKKSLAGHSDSFFIRKDRGLFDRIPFDNPVTWAFEKVWPQHVIVGVKAENAADIIAGAYGNMIWSHPLDMDGNWLLPNQVNATILQCRYGKGRLIISTFETLAKQCVYDPVGTIMLHDLIAYARGPFDPALRLRS
jgi:hypothetical protein